MPHGYRFGDVEVLPLERQLRVQGHPVNVGSRAFDVLLAMIERRGRVVTKGELLEAAWPGLCVEENNLQAQVSALRKILGAHTFATIPGIGYRFCAALESDGTPAHASGAPGTAAASNIPAPVEAMIGREVDAESVTQLVRQHRLVTITGAGGIGKTTLAQHVSRDLADEFAGGAWWADLATVTTRDMVASAIAHAANLKLNSGDATEELARAFRDRHALLVLDNCEPLAAEVAAVVRAVLTSAADIRVLVTSQEILKVPGEFVYPLDALAVPELSATLAQARTCSAIQLLERRATAADHRFTLAADNLQAAISLCRQLDGIALAIEMAAARVPVLGLTALSERLGERLSLLRSAERAPAPRYQTLRATLEWSHSLLTAEQQWVLRRLCVFVGSFRLDMAEAVCSSGDLEAASVLDCICALLDKSLVKIERIDPPRYRLLETTRLYGLERLARLGETEAALERHCRAMARLNDEVMRAFDGEPESDCLRRYLPDYDDLLAAFERAQARGNRGLAADNVMAVTRFDFARGFYFAMRRRKVAAHALLPAEDAIAHAKLWYCVAMGRFIPCPGVSKITASREEVAAWRRVGNSLQLYDALNRLAANLGTSGDFAAAEAALREARALERPEWSSHARAMHYSYATVVAAYSGDLELFESRIREERSIASDACNERVIAVSHMQSAEHALACGNLPLALQRGLVALERMRAIDNPFGLANTLSTRSDALLLDGQLEAIAPLLRESVPISLRNGIGGWTFDPLALYSVRAGHAEAAARMLGFADWCYGQIEEVRRPWDRTIEGLAKGEIGAAIGPHELARLRAEGFRMTPAQAEALAGTMLGTGFQDISAQALAAEATIR